jgi:hypothetical protein
MLAKSSQDTTGRVRRAALFMDVRATLRRTPK